LYRFGYIIYKKEKASRDPEHSPFEGNPSCVGCWLALAIVNMHTKLEVHSVTHSIPSGRKRVR